MKMRDVKVNTMYYSKRFGCYGMCTAQARYLVRMIFSKNNNEAFDGWFHCQEIEKTHPKRA